MPNLNVVQTIELQDGQMDIDAFTEAGRPSVDVDIEFIVGNGVLIGGSSESEVSFTITDEFTAGSTVKVIFKGNGRVQGPGGSGGHGFVDIDSDDKTTQAWFGPGGSGGAGSVPGQAGSGAPDGDPGTETAGGASKSCGSGSSGEAGSGGRQGNSAFKVMRPVTFDATQGDGAIWGGAGGGGGGALINGTTCFPSGAGGDPGEDGQDGYTNGGLVGGSAGAAIDGVSHVTKVGNFDIRGPEIN